MTISECYKTFNGDFEGVCERLLSVERVAKFAIRFLDNDDYEKLQDAMNKSDWEQAFFSAHTLKGLGLSLGFTRFAEVTSKLTEELRGGLKSEKMANEYFVLVTEEYNKLREGLSQYSQ